MPLTQLNCFLLPYEWYDSILVIYLLFGLAELERQQQLFNFKPSSRDAANQPISAHGCLILCCRPAG